MRKLTEREKVLLSFLAAILLVLGYGTLVHLPMENMRGEIAGEMRKMDLEERALAKFKKRYPDVEEAEEEQEERERLARRVMPREAGMGAFFSLLEGEAEKCKVRMEGITPLAPERKDGVYIQGIRVRIAADYFALLDYLRAITEGERIAHVRRAEIKAQGSILACELELEIYSRDEKITERAREEYLP